MSSELAREWMADLGGGWELGMMDKTTGEVCCGIREMDGDPIFGGSTSRQVPLYARVPDLAHPGTRAFLLEHVRKAWDGHWNQLERQSDGRSQFNVWAGSNCLFAKSAPTEAAALMAALRAAPAQGGG